MFQQLLCMILHPMLCMLWLILLTLIFVMLICGQKNSTTSSVVLASTTILEVSPDLNIQLWSTSQKPPTSLPRKQLIQSWKRSPLECGWRQQCIQEKTKCCTLVTIVIYYDLGLPEPIFRFHRSIPVWQSGCLEFQFLVAVHCCSFACLN